MDFQSKDYQSDQPNQAGDQSYSWDDVGNARRFYGQHGQDLHYIRSSSVRPEDEGWLIWTGTHWRQDLTGEVMRRAVETATAIKAELQGVEQRSLRKAASSH